MFGKAPKFWASGCLILLLAAAGAAIAAQQTGARGNGPGNRGQAPAGGRRRGAAAPERSSILILGIGTPAMSAERSGTVGWETDVHEVTSGVVFQDANVTVKAFEVPHGSWQHALGYRIDTPDRSIVISGDTRPAEAVVEACSGCDVLVHEAIFDSAVGPEYNREYHTTPAQLGEIAARAKARMVVIYHHAPASIPPSEFVRAVLEKYQGPAMFARELDRF